MLTGNVDSGNNEFLLIKGGLQRSFSENLKVSEYLKELNHGLKSPDVTEIKLGKNSRPKMARAGMAK